MNRIMLAILMLCTIIGTVESQVSTLKFTMNLNPKGHCTKYTSGTPDIKLTHARVLWTDDKGKIIGNALCNSLPDSYQKQVDCEMVGKKGARKPFILVSVKLIRERMASNDVVYRYNEDAMKMSGLKNPKDVAYSDPPFPYNTHLFIDRVKFGSEEYAVADCFIKLEAQLIDDHGYYIAGPKLFWQKMYYEPQGLDEYIVGNPDNWE